MQGGETASNIDAVFVNDTCITCPERGDDDNRIGSGASERTNAGCKLYTMGSAAYYAGSAEWGSNMALSAVTTPASELVDGRFDRFSVHRAPLSRK